MIVDPAIAKIGVFQGKPGPDTSTITNAVKVLLPYGRFKWTESDVFKYGAHEKVRFQHWLNQATRAGRLTRGAWHEKTWIGFAILSRLIRVYLGRAIEYGTMNRDIVIAKC